MDPNLFDELLNTGSVAATPQQGEEVMGPPLPEVAPVGVKPQLEPGLSDPSSFLDSALGGAAKAIYETKDFVFGEPAEKSELRENIDKKTKELSDESAVNGLVEGVSQFATGMIGLSKLKWAVDGFGWAGKAVSTVNSSKKLQVAAESAKAATVGAVAFDPHAARLSDIVESFPALSNPVSQFLKSDPKDSSAMGRVKNAMESLGLDAALIGTFVAGTRLLKAFKSGDDAAIAEALEEATTAVAPKVEPEAAPVAVEPDAPPLATTLADDAVAAPVAPPRASPEALIPAPDAPAPVVLDDVVQPAAADASTITALEAAPLVSDQQVLDLVATARSDADALAAAGSWDGAIGAGHVFGRGSRIPWQKLPGTVDGKPESAVDAFIARVADGLKEPLDVMKGGDVMSDAQVQRMVTQRANLWGEDPAALMGLLQGAGENARTMAANMEASFLVSQRAMQDAYTMAARINAGYLDEFGGNKEAAQAALKEMVSVASTAFGHAQSMRSAAGRTMRRLRGEFQLKEADVAALKSMDGAQLANVLAATEGDPRALAKVMSPGLWKRGMDAAQYLYVNNLLWGWKTQVINLATNAYMVGARPLERILGSLAKEALGNDSAKRFRLESQKQYAYMGSSLYDAWQAAVKTWKLGDSVMAPHSTEVNQTGHSIGKAVAQLEFKSWDSLPNVLHNALLVSVPKIVGTPTRALGTVDELIKQVVYRSKVQAQAHIEGISSGLDGADLTRYVQDKLYGAFDEAGVATDMVARQEAQIATFQQDLLPGTIGKSTQNFTNNHPLSKLVLPFVKTPTNVIRYGVKMTPGLNALQSEYRQMIRGAMGPEAQAQAVGQMAMGSLFLGTAAYLAASGMITGGGPTDPKQAAVLRATGHQPYSFVIPHEDGTRTYIPFGRLDPVAMPFGMVADLVDILSQDNDDDKGKVEQMSLALLMGISKQLANKTYLMSITQTMDAIMDPDRNMARVAGQTTSNFVPMASALRFSNPDPYLRDSRDLMDSVMATIPGLSDNLPPRRDVWGDPLTVNKGLWVSGDRDVVDAEMRRMITSAGVSVGPPSPTVNGADLREITLTDGRNAYDVYQQLAGKPTPRSRPLKDTVAAIMKTPAYVKAPDGDATTRGTKLFMIHGAIAKYREGALKRVKADPNVRTAIMKKETKVRAAYAASKPSPVTSPAQQLSNLGKAYGMDLDGLLK